MKKILRASVNALPLSVRHWIKHVPGVAASQRWLVNRVLSGDSFVHTINAGPARGLRFEVTLPADKAFWSGTFETEFSETLHQAVRRGDVCYDIGGYRGYMSGIMALAGASRVIVFEPLPQNLSRLRRLAELNPGLPVRIEEAAVGRTDGMVSFKVMADQSMGKLADSPFQSGAASAAEIPVRLTRLDTCVFEGGLQPPDLIKIDVEGAEVDVLEGADRTLREYRPRIYLEAHSATLADQCVERLTSLGYKTRQLENGHVPPGHARHLVANPV